jgi:beta-glucosidase
LKAIRAKAPKAKVEYHDGVDLPAAAALAKASDVAIVFVNEPTSEGRDLPTLSLSGKQNELVSAVAAANLRTVVVLETGGPAAMPWIGSVGAAIEIWYPGIRGAEALAGILFGDVNPSAKLPATFPKSDADLPHPVIFGSAPAASAPPAAAPAAGARPAGAPPAGAGGAPPRMSMAPFDIDYTEGLKVGYKWFQAENKQPLFPFGHGLSYTTFAYSGLKAAIDSVSFTVRNTGKRSGTEIAQVYAGLPAAADEPPKRLVAWEKIQLAPGEARTVTVKLEPKFLSIFNEEKDDWELLAGEYRIFVGGSSDSTPLAASVKR